MRTAMRRTVTGTPVLGSARVSKEPTVPVSCTVFTRCWSHCVTSSGGVLCDAAGATAMRGRRLAAAGLLSGSGLLHPGARVARLRACRIAHS